MGRMIRITEEYRIAPSKGNTLRHFCSRRHPDSYFRMYGVSVGVYCHYCRKPTPKKIQFIFNLWKFHNG